MDDYFLVAGYDFFRVRLIMENNATQGMREIFDNGSITHLTKNNSGNTP